MVEMGVPTPPRSTVTRCECGIRGWLIATDSMVLRRRMSTSQRRRPAACISYRAATDGMAYGCNLPPPGLTQLTEQTALR